MLFECLEVVSEVVATDPHLPELTFPVKHLLPVVVVLAEIEHAKYYATTILERRHFKIDMMLKLMATFIESLVFVTHHSFIISDESMEGRTEPATPSSSPLHNRNAYRQRSATRFQENPNTAGESDRETNKKLSVASEETCSPSEEDEVPPVA